MFDSIYILILILYENVFNRFKIPTKVKYKF